MTTLDWILISFAIIFTGLYAWYVYEEKRRKKIERYLSAKNAVFYTMKHFKRKK